MDLPNQLQRKLNVPGLRHHRGLQTPRAGGRSARIEQLGSISAKKGQGWPKVGVIQYVEKLRPELHAEAFRNLRDCEVLVCREIKVEEPRTVNAIAARIANEIRASARDSGIRISRTSRAKAERDALRSDLRSRLRQCEAIVVDVAHENSARIAFEIVV